MNEETKMDADKLGQLKEADWIGMQRVDARQKANEETSERVFVHVPWDGENVEIRMLNAIEDLCRKGRREGLTATGVARIGRYIASAALDQSIPVQEPKP